MVIGGAVLLTGIIASRALAGLSPSPSPSPPGNLLASTDDQAQGEPIDRISCQQFEQVLYHIHAELMVFVAGQSRVIPEGIGIVPPITTQQTTEGPFVVSGRCFYWLHSHTRDGIIHIESPSERTYPLGNYFDIWRQPLSSTQVGPATGTVTVYVNGLHFSGDPRSIVLTAHAVIQLNVGKDMAPQTFTFPPGL